MPAAFSRLQLAAALLEYDNDPDDPDAPYRSAQESAIFAHLRRNPAARPEVSSHQSDYASLSLPNDASTLGGRESALDNRRSRGSRGSRGSLDALRNPFGVDGHSEYDDESHEQEPELEVDLSSWGLDAFIPKEKTKSSKSKDKQSMPPTLHSVRARQPPESPSELDDVEDPASYRRPSSSMNTRRQSTSSRLDYVEGSNASAFQRHRAGSQSIIPNLQSEQVPFPSGRSPSPGYDQIGSPRDQHHLPERSYSRASLNSRMHMDNVQDEEDEMRRRTYSQGTLATVQLAEDNPFALQPPTHASRFDPKAAAHARTMSNASMGTRFMMDDDVMSVTTRETYPPDRPYSTLELLRPKVLVMPSPLQPVGAPPQTEHTHTRGGFQISTDGPPLPPGARSSRRLSLNFESMPIASNSFIPNPSADLSLSQKVFRNTLVVGGQSGQNPQSEDDIPRATTDGEQIQFGTPIIEEAQQPLGTEKDRGTRPAGKLFGKSLIDDLEDKKAQMRSKQRVFTGDQRPSMMARDSSSRISTFIDPASLQGRPSGNRQSSYGSQGSQNALGRRNSVKPLLNFDDDEKVPQLSTSPARPSNSRSVFGVDTLWEKEMVKLREIQEKERLAEEERKRNEEESEKRRIEKENRKNKKIKNKNKNKKRGTEENTEELHSLPIETHLPTEPPTLPDVKPLARRLPPKVADDESSSESEDDMKVVGINHKNASVAWHSGSDDEVNQPRRTTGIGLRYPKQARVGPPGTGSDSEEDLPLAATMRRAKSHNLKVPRKANDSEDEDRPLSHILRQTKSAGNTPLDVNLDKFSLYPNGTLHHDDDEDDDQPLGLRASKMIPTRALADSDDDKPLAFHPEQQRRTQYQLFVQQHQQHQQQQQQQLMLQAQMQSSMFFNAPLMNSPFFTPPMMNPMAMMQNPIPIPSPPPIHDEAKFVSVDRWRRDVMVEGDH